MKFISAQKIRRTIKIKGLINEIEKTYRNDSFVPLRQVYNIIPQNNEAQLMVMPAFSIDGYYGVKLLNVFPNNPSFGLPRVKALYVLYEQKNGEIKLILDGTEITKQRTAAMSAIASKFLSKKNSKILLVIGTGALVSYMINAHCSVRPIENILIWGRNINKVKNIVKMYKDSKLKVSSINSLEEACGIADIITSITSAKKEFIKGSWLNKSVHIDLVGAHTKYMAELDPHGFSLGEIYVDDKEAALIEAGDLMQSIKLGIVNKNDIKADIQQLIISNNLKRDKKNKVTIYKSVGHALSDLASANYIYKSLNLL
ncbi:MAG: ornithine cyclodeaminase family protein [Alphaproteobacteria bacterium]|tara:strand:- start:154 stop:1095 length:942 start_codon:yes stop_codon:yes gene_type:complete